MASTMTARVLSFAVLTAMLFSFPRVGQAQTETVLHNFTALGDGGEPLKSPHS